MMDKEFAYLLFIKMYRNDLYNYAMLYSEKQDLTEDERRALHLIGTSFINFLTKQLKHRFIKPEAIDYWVQVHRRSIDVHKRHFFAEALQYALTEVLHKTEHSNKEQILTMHNDIVARSIEAMKYWNYEKSSIQDGLTSSSIEKLNEFSLELIQHNGTEDLSVLLTRAEEIFHFKRCNFFSYNPWLEEFSGVIGAEIDKIEKIRGKIEIEPVFAMKKPIFLKNPSPYVQQVVIDRFGLSSVIFIPVIFDQQLYGWITFDQLGEEFDCSEEIILLLEQVGTRLGMFLGRKQVRSNFNFSIDLKEKEYMVLFLVIEGYSNKEIAELIYLSEFTVRDYVKKLMIKLNARNRSQIISTAFRIGLVE